MGLKFLSCFGTAVLFAALIPVTSHAQAKNGTAAPPVPAPDFTTKYDRSPAGLLVQFQMILTNAKDPEKAKLLVEELEIPKYDDYFDKVYRKDVALFWSGSYTRALLSAAGEFQSLFARMGMQEGEFVIRKINETPASKLEEALTSKMNGPVDIYAVSWKKRTAKDDSDNDLLGYYAYFNNRFRWYYMLGFPKIPGQPPKTAAKPAPKSAPPKTSPAAGAANPKPAPGPPAAQ